MTSFVTPKKNTQYIHYTSLGSQADTDINQVNPTLAAGDVQVSKDGGALTNLATLPAVTPAGGKLVRVILSADEMNADNVAVVFCDAAGDEWQDQTWNIQTTAQQIDDLSTVTTAQVATALTTYDAPTKAEMDTAHALLATPAQVATALTTYDGPTSAEMDAGHALLATPAQVATALTTYDGPTKAEMDTGHGLLTTPAQVATALTTYDGPTKDEMDTAHALLTTPAQVATALGTYDAPTKAELDAGLAALNDVTDQEVWEYATRTLTQSAASVTAAVAGSDITIARGDTLSAALTGLGALTGYVSIDFTVKENKAAADTAAIIRIRKNASGSSDGLLILNGATAGTAGNGSITIDVEGDGDITIALAAAETDDLVERGNLYYDVQMITSSAVTTMTTGSCTISADVTRAIA